MGVFSFFSKEANLYFPGCIAYFGQKDKFELWKEIFSRLGIDFKIIEKNICCGLPALEAGYDSESRKIARRNFEIFKEERITSIIAPCPACYKMFLFDYEKFLPDWNIGVVNIWDLIKEKLEKKPGIIENKSDEEIGFQDSCYLGRHSKIYDSPREILELIGYRIKEMANTKENSFCSGSCGGLPRYNPELADKSAQERLLQAKRAGIRKLVVCSLEEYNLLNKNAGDKSIEILDFSEILGNALGIEMEGKNE